MNYTAHILQLPDEKAMYLLRGLAHHLFEGESPERVHQLLSLYDYLLIKAHVVGIQALIDDFDFGSGEGLLHLRRALILAQHTLEEDPTQLSGQLIGRLLWVHDELLAKTLERAKTYRGSAWLCPLESSLIPTRNALIRSFNISGEVTTLTFSSDGRYLVCGSSLGLIVAWQLEPVYRQLYRLSGHTGKVTSLSFTGDNEFVTSGLDGTLRIWQLEDGALRSTLSDDGVGILSMAIIQKGTRAVVSAVDRTLRIWDLQTNSLLTKFRNDVGVWHSAQTLSDDQSICFLAAHDLGIARASWQKSYRLTKKEKVYAFTVSDNVIFAALGGGKTLKITLVQEKAEKSQNAFSLGKAVYSMTVVHGSEFIAVAASDGIIRLAPLSLHQRQVTLTNFGGEINTIRAHPSLPLVASGSRDGSVKLWDTKQAFTPEKHILPSTHPKLGRVSSLSPIPDNSLILVGTNSGEFHLWDQATNKVIFSNEDHLGKDHRVRAFAYDLASNRGAVILRHAAYIPIFRLSDLASIGVVGGIGKQPIALAITTNGETLIIAARRQLTLLTLPTGLQKKTTGFARNITSMGVSMDSAWVLIGFENGNIEVRDIADLNWNYSLRSENGAVTCLLLLEDGETAVGGTDLGVLELWSIKERRSITIMKGHDNQVTAMSVIPNTNKLVSVSRDRRVIVWDLSTATKVAVFTCDTSVTHCAVTKDAIICVCDYSGDLHQLQLVI